jgi:formylglycine-generating enzyme required for sulfatase activity
MTPSSFAAPYVVAASALAAAALVSAAAADVTYTLTNETFTGWDVNGAYAAGSLTGILTGASINVTLNASKSTFADDLCIYVAPAPFGTFVQLQCGGFSNLGAAARYYWPNGASGSPGTTSIGTVNFTTGIDMTANPSQAIWIGTLYNQYNVYSSGTWTGTITLIGVNLASGPCTIDTDLDGRPDCDDNCINIANSNQLNTDGDTRGDACDNCPLIANSSQADCNTDGIGDVCEIAAGAPDFNQDTIPDTCQCGTIPSLPTCCPGDLDHDAAVGGADIGLLLSNWGPCASACLYDLNDDDKVNGGDLGLLLSGWGPCPAPIIVPTWATLVEAMPDPAVVTDSTLRAAITASGMAWRVRDTATQMEMLLAPAGTFTMGCTASFNQGCDGDENPTHSVTLTQAFYMGRYEVTQGQWVAKMGSNPSYFLATLGYSDAANRPVERVSWNTIQGYLSATGMRLPSEAEWEYACRAGTTTAFNNGSSNDATVGTIAWYSANSGNQNHAVGGRAANALGLYDMSGNVWEWVNDWYDGSYYSVSPSTNPLGPVTGTYGVIRGGSWIPTAFAARSSHRLPFPPGDSYSTIGFRVARDP